MISFLTLLGFIALIFATPIFVPFIKETVQNVRNKYCGVLPLWVTVTSIISIILLMWSLLVTPVVYLDGFTVYIINYVFLFSTWSGAIPKVYKWYWKQLDKGDDNDNI